MNNVSPVVKNLIILNVIVFFVASMTNFNTAVLKFGLFHPLCENFLPVQIVSHMFLHGSILHLFFNMYGLYVLGTWVEYRWGPRRFLFYYLFCGLFAALTQILSVHYEMMQHDVLPCFPTIGASGALFGIIAAFGIVFRDVELSLLFPPVTIKAKYFAFGYGALELIQGFSSSTSNIAHFAHVGGLIGGVILYLIWRNRGIV